HTKNKGFSKRFQPWVLIHLEKMETKQEAMQREKQLKSHQGRNFIRVLIHSLFEPK
ncbi:MAG: GIY-YIG nuclease family protein, partial [Bacteroidota bacterium]